jgi:hypothetical protein
MRQNKHDDLFTLNYNDPGNLAQKIALSGDLSAKSYQ